MIGYKEFKMQLQGLFLSNLSFAIYNEFIMADGSGKPRYEYMKERRVRIGL